MDTSFSGASGAVILTMKAYAYYITLAADGTPAFFRSSLTNGGGIAGNVALELVRGLENIQYHYGVDITGDGVANRYVNADNIGVGTVVSIRLHALFRSSFQVTPVPQAFDFFGVNYVPADRFLRQEFISTIKLRN